MSEYVPTTEEIIRKFATGATWQHQSFSAAEAEIRRWLAAHDAEVRASVVPEEPDVTALRAARAETWDEAIATVFAWWSTPEGERPAAIVNPYGVGMPAEQENES